METIGCLATWCPCILYGKTQARRDGDPETSCCTGSVCLISLYFTNNTLLTSALCVWTGAPSHFANYNG